MVKNVPLLIDGEFVQSSSNKKTQVINPATQEILAEVPHATQSEMEKAVSVAKNAFKSWSEVPPSDRMRYMLKYQDLLKKNQKEIAATLCKENGKNFADGMGDVFRGIEVVEHACSAPSLLMGETIENAARGINIHSFQKPLGVCAGITPFNFPAMIPLWMFPIAIASGNTFILKPSEQDPMTPMLLAELFNETGIPKGVLNVIHGGKEQVDFLLTNKHIEAISFVGSAPVAEYIYHQGTAHNKRVQCFAGAKNHMVVMPDAPKEAVLNALVGASCGAAGQRCMAISVAIMVGDSVNLIPELRSRMSHIKAGPWDKEDSDYGPLVSAKAKEKVERLIGEGVSQGATLLLDGRNYKVPGFDKGNFVGPTLFDNVKTEMSIYQEEIFGPVLLLLRAKDLDEALEIIERNPFGNGTSIFTSSGPAAQKFQHNVTVGQVGINIPIPVPLPFFSFTGWKGSFFGDQHAYGKMAFRFYTKTQTITTKWFEDDVVKGKTNMTISLK